MGVVPAFNNPPIEPQNYQPRNFMISAVSLGYPTTVTTTVDHNYVVGQLVRLLIPPTFGCRQLNGQEAYCIGVPAANQMQLAINSNGDDAYIASSASTQAQTVAVGNIAGGAFNSIPSSQTTYISGSFINIS